EEIKMGLKMKLEHMHTFQQFEVPTAIKHGVGAIQYVGEEVKQLGATKVLLVTDPGIYEAGVTKPVEKSLEEAGLEIVLFNKVEPKPTVRSVAEGANQYEEARFDGHVAVGGVSAMDKANASGVELDHDG